MKRVSIDQACRYPDNRASQADVNHSNRERARSHTYSDEFSFDGEACLVAGNGEVGNLSYYSGKFEAYQRTYVLMDFDGVLGEFLYFILQGSLKMSLFDQRLGNTIPYIKKGMLTDFEVPVPPLEEQHELTEKLQLLSASAKELVDASKSKLDALANLRQSLLQKAFSGELT